MENKKFKLVTVDTRIRTEKDYVTKKSLSDLYDILKILKAKKIDEKDSLELIYFDFEQKTFKKAKDISINLVNLSYMKQLVFKIYPYINLVTKQLIIDNLYQSKNQLLVRSQLLVLGTGKLNNKEAYSTVYINSMNPRENKKDCILAVNLDNKGFVVVYENKTGVYTSNKLPLTELNSLYKGELKLSNYTQIMPKSLTMTKIEFRKKLAEYVNNNWELYEENDYYWRKHITGDITNHNADYSNNYFIKVHIQSWYNDDEKEEDREEIITVDTFYDFIMNRKYGDKEVEKSFKDSVKKAFGDMDY